MKVMTWRVRKVVKPVLKSIGKTIVPYTIYVSATEHHPPDVFKFVTDTTCVETISLALKTSLMFIVK